MYVQSWKSGTDWPIFWAGIETKMVRMNVDTQMGEKERVEWTE